MGNCVYRLKCRFLQKDFDQKLQTSENNRTWWVWHSLEGAESRRYEVLRSEGNVEISHHPEKFRFKRMERAESSFSDKKSLHSQFEICIPRLGQGLFSN